MTNHFDPLQPVLGYLTAAASAAVLWVGQIVDNLPISKGWLELGGTIGLVTGLSYGCVTLWKALQNQRVEMNQERREFIAAKDNLEKEIRTDWKQQNEKLIAVLERLEPHNED